MATKNDIREFQKLITQTKDEIDEFFDDKFSDIEMFLETKGLNEYNVIYETFDKIESSKNTMLDSLEKMKRLLSKILQSQ